MGFTLQSNALMAGVPTNAMTVNAYRASRFALPNTDDPVPDGLPADAGPVSSGNSALNGDGYFALPVPDSDPYYVTAVGSDGHTYWLSAIPPVADTVQQAFGQTSANLIGHRHIARSTIAAGSNGATLPQSTIYLANVTFTPGSAGFFETSGIVAILTSSTWNFVSYTGVDSVNKALTGCTGGTGTLITGQTVGQVYRNGSRRMDVLFQAEYIAQASGDSAFITPRSTINGVFTPTGSVGVSAWTAATSLDVAAQAIVPVDPNGYYGMFGQVSGSGVITLDVWLERLY